MIACSQLSWFPDELEDCNEASQSHSGKQDDEHAANVGQAQFVCFADSVVIFLQSWKKVLTIHNWSHSSFSTFFQRIRRLVGYSSWSCQNKIILQNLLILFFKIWTFSESKWLYEQQKKKDQKMFTRHFPPPLFSFHHLVFSMCSFPLSCIFRIALLIGVRYGDPLNKIGGKKLHFC